MRLIKYHSVRRCGGCGHLIPAAMPFCPYCGQQLNINSSTVPSHKGQIQPAGENVYKVPELEAAEMSHYEPQQSNVERIFHAPEMEPEVDSYDHTAQPKSDLPFFSRLNHIPAKNIKIGVSCLIAFFAGIILVNLLSGKDGAVNNQTSSSVKHFKKKEKAETAVSEEVSTEAAHVFIRAFYEDYVFGVKEFDDDAAQKYCTDRLIQQLQSDYEDEGYTDLGYAIWDFHVFYENMDGNSSVRDVRDWDKNTYIVDVVEAGHLYMMKVTLTETDGEYKFDSVEQSFDASNSANE